MSYDCLMRIPDNLLLLFVHWNLGPSFSTAENEGFRNMPDTLKWIFRKWDFCQLSNFQINLIEGVMLGVQLSVGILILIFTRKF